MSTDTLSAPAAILAEKKAQLQNRLDAFVGDGRLTREQADQIVSEAARHDFTDSKAAADDLISYTGWLTLAAGVGGGWYFSSWSGNFTMEGWLAPAVGAAFFFYARMEIYTKFDYDGCTGGMSFQVTPIAMTLRFGQGDKDHIKVGEGATGGPAPALGAGAGNFTIRRH